MQLPAVWVLLAIYHAECPRNILRTLRPVVSPSRINIQCISCARLVSHAARFAAREASVVSAALS